MKNISMAILAACLGALNVSTIHAQQPNTAYGTGALASSAPDSGNSAFGYDALNANTYGPSNTAMGAGALQFNTFGSSNTAIGARALSANTDGTANTASGANALQGNTTGSFNASFGDRALVANTTGESNIAIGADALVLNSVGYQNTAVGRYSLAANTAGGGNIALGFFAGVNIIGSSNIDIGSYGGRDDNGVIRIGNSPQHTSFYAAGISGVQIREGVPVYINSDGQLGTVNSSIRFKEDVHDMADASSKLFQLRPVTYRYKQAYADGSKPVDYGLIAEEVAKVYPDLVARDASGQILTVQYQKLTPMLLNELQKQHRQVEAQQETIRMLEKRLSALEAAMGANHTQDTATATE
jgi:hypothetical protein